MVDETIIRTVELLRLQPGDILVVETGDLETPEEYESIVEAFKNALNHAGLTETVSMLLHDGNINLKIVRSA